MRTLTDFTNELDLSISKLGINSLEVQSLKILLADSLYLNESEGTSIVLESNPATCLLLNSSIMHACGKGYSVFRGLNPRVSLMGLTCTTSRSVKKYDEFLSIQGYKLIYARDYDFVINNVYTIDLILARDVESGYFKSNNRLAYNIAQKDISEDFYLYSVNNLGSSPIDIIDHIPNSLGNLDVIGLTISDYGIKLLSLGRFNNDQTFYYKFVPYLTETVDLTELINSINRIPYFSFTKLSIDESEDSFTQIQGVARDEDKDGIYIKSIRDQSGIVKSTTSLDGIVEGYLSAYITMCKSQFSVDGNLVSLVKVYYQLKDSDVGIPTQLLKDLVSYIKVTYFNPDMGIGIDSFEQAHPLVNTGKKIKITYKASRDHYADIVKALKSLQSSYIGGEFNLNSITSAILKSADDIEFVNLSQVGEGEVMDTIVDLDPAYYPDLINNDDTLGTFIHSIGLGA